MFGAWVTAVSALICFGSFAWAVKGHFLLHRPMTARMRAIAVVSPMTVAWFLERLIRRQATELWPVSAVMIGVALTLFWWAVATTRSPRLALAFSDDTPAFLQTDGPYRCIRHPFYASYILFWIATSLATRGALQWVVPVAWGAVYISAAKREERKFGMSPLAGQYQCYRANTGMLLPLKRRCWRG